MGCEAWEQVEADATRADTILEFADDASQDASTDSSWVPFRSRPWREFMLGSKWEVRWAVNGEIIGCGEILPCRPLAHQHVSQFMNCSTSSRQLYAVPAMPTIDELNLKSKHQELTTKFRVATASACCSLSFRCLPLSACSSNPADVCGLGRHHRATLRRMETAGTHSLALVCRAPCIRRSSS